VIVATASDFAAKPAEKQALPLFATIWHHMLSSRLRDVGQGFPGMKRGLKICCPLHKQGMGQ